MSTRCPAGLPAADDDVGSVKVTLLPTCGVVVAILKPPVPAALVTSAWTCVGPRVTAPAAAQLRVAMVPVVNASGAVIRVYSAAPPAVPSALASSAAKIGSGK